MPRVFDARRHGGAVLERVRRFQNLFDDIDLDPHVIGGPHIAGVEITQAIQYYRAHEHLTNANDRGADNSLMLAAHKPAYVRVYLRSGWFGFDETLTGEVRIERRSGPLHTVWTPVIVLTPTGASALTTQVNPAYAVERASLGATLNFVVPAASMRGVLRVTARVWRSGDASRQLVDEWEEVVDASTLQTVRLRGIFVRYDGTNPMNTPPTPLQLPAPTVADLQSTAAWALTIMPVEADGVFSSGGTMNWFVPLTGAITPEGNCPDSWSSLLAWLNLMRLNDGNRSDVIYYGLLPAAIPAGPVTGCESGGIGAGRDTDQTALAHEVGHACGLAHGPCGNAQRTDPNFPAYEPYDPANTARASLGEYGLDVSTGAIHQPTERDFMSYCQNWISLYHHASLSRNERLDPRTVGVDVLFEPPELVDPYLWPWEYIPDPPHGPVWLRTRAARLIAIVGVIDEGRFELTSVMRIQAVPHQVADAVATQWSAQLIGDEGEVAARAPLMRLQSRPCGCDARRHCDDQPPRRYVVEALIPDTTPGRELRIIGPVEAGESRPAGSAVLWSRTAPSRPTRIRAFNVTIARGQAIARWEASCANGAELSYSLQFSKDRGRSWNGLTVGVREDRYAFSLADLPSGPIVFRLLAHDGFATASAESRPINVPERSPTIAILHPREGGHYYLGVPLRLWAAISTHDGSKVEPDACTWTLDGERVGSGPDVFITPSTPGEHECALRVRRGATREQVKVRFIVRDPTRPHEAQLAAPTPRARRAKRGRKRR